MSVIRYAVLFACNIYALARFDLYGRFMTPALDGPDEWVLSVWFGANLWEKLSVTMGA